MLAPKVAKAQTKAAEAEPGKQMPYHSTLATRPLCHGLFDPAQMLRRTTPDQSDAVSPVAPDFSSIPVFPPQHSSRAEPQSSFAAAPFPHQASANLPVGAVNDPLEREASMIAERAIRFGEAHPLLEQGLSRARLHISSQPGLAAGALNAAAYTVGEDIVFGAGQYRPDTVFGQRLIAHEAVHVGQQMRSGRPMVQRQQGNTVQMPPLQVSGDLYPTETSVKHLDQLTNVGVNPQNLAVAWGQSEIERNTPDPTAPLPFDANGWNGADILRRLGQYDQIPGTDSEAIRCVQAVGMAARVPDGPSAVISYIGALVLQGMLTGQMTGRKRTAIQVLKHVTARIESRRATFGDLSWAQEAMHDLFYDDASGTPLTDIPGQVAPGFDLTKNMQPMDVWCDTPQEVMAQAAVLQPGEQLLIEEWSVSLNTAFDRLSEQHIEVAEGQSIVVDINGRQVRIRRIPISQRPPHSALDFSRDTAAGHQLLIMKDSASGKVRLYEPEVTPGGSHFQGLDADGSNLATYFGDQPKYGIYHYIEIIGKLQRGLAAPSAAHP